MLKKPEARIIVDSLKERGFLKRSLLSEIEKDIAIYIEEENEGENLSFIGV